MPSTTNITACRSRLTSPHAHVPKISDYALIIRHDQLSWHGHTILTLMSPEGAVSFGFHPQTNMHPLPRIIPRSDRSTPPLRRYGRILMHKSYTTARTIRAAFTLANGQVCNENDRPHGASSIFPITAEQYHIALKTVEQWQKHPPHYQAAAITGHNCVTFIFDVMRKAKIHIPISWEGARYPMTIKAAVSWAGLGRQLIPSLQPRTHPMLHVTRKETQTLKQLGNSSPTDPR